MIRVALTMRITEANDYHEPRDSISHDWLARLRDWGFTPLLVPNIQTDAAAYVTHLRPDLLILTGGEDLGVSVERDRTEAALLDCALRDDWPVLGVCRGLQFINTHLGGRLSPVQGHVNREHIVDVAPAWQSVRTDRARVNSFHNLGIPPDGTGDGLLVGIRDEEGFVEAAHLRDRPVAAVMWHPERGASHDGDRRLILGLAQRQLPWL